MIKEILLSAESSSEALNNLYLELKKRDSKFSIGYLCQRSAIPSRGYLGDVLKGKRLIGIKYIDSLINAFPLKPIEKEILKSLIQIDYASSEKEKSEYFFELEALRKIYQTEEKSYLVDCNSYITSVIYASFGIPSVESGHSFESLCEMFPNLKDTSIKASLESLLNHDLIKLKGGTYYLSEDQRAVMMKKTNSQEEEIERLRFLNSFLNMALRKLNTSDLADSSENYYESSVLSVKKSDLKNIKNELQKSYDKCLSKYEVLEGDCLLVANFQCFSASTESFLEVNI